MHTWHDRPYYHLNTCVVNKIILSTSKSCEHGRKYYIDHITECQHVINWQLPRAKIRWSGMVWSELKKKRRSDTKKIRMDHTSDPHVWKRHKKEHIYLFPKIIFCGLASQRMVWVGKSRKNTVRRVLHFSRCYVLKYAVYFHNAIFIPVALMCVSNEVLGNPSYGEALWTKMTKNW